MSKLTEAHTLIIQIRLDNSEDDLRYEVDKVTVAKGQIPKCSDPAAQFDCLHCSTRYFISPEIAKIVELDLISNASEPTEMKEESLEEQELDMIEFIFEPGSSDKVRSDGHDILQSVDYEILPEVSVSNEDIQEPETSANENRVRIDAQMEDNGQNNYQHPKKETKPKKSRFYTCDICNASIKHHSSLKRHMNVHMGIRFSCSKCPKSFSDKSHLADHNKRFHQSELRSCQVCKRRINCTKSEFLLHLRHHPTFGKREPRLNVQNFNTFNFQCVYCKPKATFMSFEELQEHLGDAHDRNFACTRCSKAYTQNYHLNNHIESIHEEKKYRCQKCNKVYKWKAALNIHLRTHK